MLAVALSAEQIGPYFAKVRKEGQWGPVVACYNSPESITVSGIEDQIDELIFLLTEANVFNRKLRVNVAYHSPQMKEVALEYLERLTPLNQGYQYTHPVGMISSVTGGNYTASEISKASYWVENMVSPVQFSQAVENMCKKSPKSVTKKLNRSHRSAVAVDYLLEIGPHGALRGPVREILKFHHRGTDIKYDSLLSRNISALDTLLQAVGRLHCSGYKVNLPAINGLSSKSSKTAWMALPSLPEYQFNHSQRHWHESRITSDLKHKNHRYMELLGKQSLDWNPLTPCWRNFLRIKDMPWIEDHKVCEKIQSYDESC
jgi:acyl transferase domain-containing protein